MKAVIDILDDYEAKLNDPRGDGTGNDSRPPDGDDYNAIDRLVRLELAKPVTVYVVTAEHPTVPGLLMKPFASKESATAEAVYAINMMLSDTESACKPKPATAETWESALEWLQDYHGAAHCFVEITETKLQD